MTLPWLPLPRTAGLDACLRGTTDAARGVWLLLLCATDDHGNIPGAGAQSFEDVVDAVAGMGAGAHLDELRGMGLVLCDVGPVRGLHLPHVLRWRAELEVARDTLSPIGEGVLRALTALSWVYAIGPVGGGVIKIGYSTDPLRRLADLQTAHSEKLAVFALMPGGESEELDLHVRFAKYRTRSTGEWFRLTASVLAWCRKWGAA